ncbi:MAG: hypothetical protein EON93_05735 [Burkholderiales bacterium]|nr:MAG: hypothetical protein EON93_05735 [Burkholderiales bacterium]
MRPDTPGSAWLAVAFGLSVLVPTACFGAEPSPAKLLGPLRDQSAIDGCAWYASSDRVGKGYMFLAEYDQSRILMNIDGLDTDLKRTSARGHLKKLGSVLTNVYRSNKGAVVYATYRTTWLCPTDGTHESCEVTRFKVSFEAVTGNRRQIVHTTGEAGC